MRNNDEDCDEDGRPTTTTGDEDWDKEGDEDYDDDYDERTGTLPGCKRHSASAGSAPGSSSSAAGSRCSARWSLAIRAYTEGTTNSVNSVPMVMPPTSTTPMELR